MADIPGLDNALRQLTELANRGPAAMGAALFEEGERIMTRSKAEFVPVDLGTLRSAGHVRPPVIRGSAVEVVLGYGGPAVPYALKVHENPRAGKTQGLSPSGKRYKTWARVGQWKYLEEPVKQAVAGMPERVARSWERVSGLAR